MTIVPEPVVSHQGVRGPEQQWLREYCGAVHKLYGGIYKISLVNLQEFEGFLAHGGDLPIDRPRPVLPRGLNKQ